MTAWTLGCGMPGGEAADLTPFLAGRACEVAMTDVSDGDVAVIVYREDETWDTEVLPTALTEDLSGLIHALRQQPSIGGTIGLVTVGDDFFVALRVIGGEASEFMVRPNRTPVRPPRHEGLEVRHRSRPVHA